MLKSNLPIREPCGSVAATIPVEVTERRRVKCTKHSIGTEKELRMVLPEIIHITYPYSTITQCSDCMCHFFLTCVDKAGLIFF